MITTLLSARSEKTGLATAELIVFQEQRWKFHDLDQIKHFEVSR
jgi:hypothetical protein